MQGVAAGIAAALGPAHVHQQANRPLLLEDFRRVAATVAPPAHVATAFGHFHGKATPIRHHHAAGDASVVLVDDPLRAWADAESASAGSSLALFSAVLPTTLAWVGQAPAGSPACCAAWPSLTHDPQPLERPPRPA